MAASGTEPCNLETMITDISKENQQKIAQMSREEILVEQEQLAAMLSKCMCGCYGEKGLLGE